MSLGTVKLVELDRLKNLDKWYGYERDLTSRSKIPTRIGNMDLHRSCPIQNKIARYVENIDGTVNYWLHPSNSLLRWDNGLPSDLTGADGNLMLFKPGFYFKAEVEGTKLRKMYSEYPLPGFTYLPPMKMSWVKATFDNINDRAAAVCSLVFDENGDPERDVNGFPVMAPNAAQFRGGANNATLDGTATSQLGMSRTNVAKATVRPKCAAIGAHHGNYRMFSQLAGLYTLEYCNYDAQEAYNPALTADGFKQGGLGSGTAVVSSEWSTFNGYYGYIPEGVTAKLGNQTGVVDYVIKDWGGLGVDKTVQVASWHGLEKYFEYQWELADDLLVYHQSDAEGGLSIAYVCDNPDLFANPANDSLPAIPTGYVERASLPRMSAYGLNEAANSHGDMLITEISGSANEGLCDYYYFPTGGQGWYGALLVGSGYAGTACGSRYVDTANRSSLAYAPIGFRLGRN